MIHRMPLGELRLGTLVYRITYTFPMIYGYMGPDNELEIDEYNEYSLDESEALSKVESIAKAYRENELITFHESQFSIVTAPARQLARWTYHTMIFVPYAWRHCSIDSFRAMAIRKESKLNERYDLIELSDDVLTFINSDFIQTELVKLEMNLKEKK